MPRVVGSERRRRDVVAAPPDLYLRLAVLCRGFRLVQPLERAVMTLVQAPVLLDGNPKAIEPVECDVERSNGTLQQRCVGDVEVVLTFAQQSAGLGGFFAALVGQVDIGPAGEPVFLVPGALAVTEQDDLGHREMADRPAYFAAEPSSSSMRRSWLYLQVRSVRLAEPVLI